MREKLKLAHQIARDALSVEHAEKQYNKTAARMHYK
ncbi:uncharacterized, partial [Tachysurus ichikawai]